MCSRRRAQHRNQVLAAATKKAEETALRQSRPILKEPTMTNTTPARLSDDARMGQINSEILQNADIAPPSYEEATSSQSRTRDVHPSLAAAPTAPREKAAKFEEFSDVESDDSEWEDETVAGINTPATTVYGGDDHRDGIAPSKEISNSSPSLLEYIHAQHGQPSGAWTKEDWKAAKAAFKAERREAKAHFRAERSAWKQERREIHRAHREDKKQEWELHRALSREVRDEKRAARRGCCGC